MWCNVSGQPRHRARHPPWTSISTIWLMSLATCCNCLLSTTRWQPFILQQLCRDHRVLKPEDKKADLTLQQGHQAAAWAVRASTAVSFFTRSSLFWLQQLQERIPATCSRAHQDLNKIVAAIQFSSDAILSITRFASQAMASVASCRLLWLRQWQADMRHKWRLPSAPYKGGGRCLENP